FYEIFLGLYQGEETNLLSWNSHGCLRLFVSGIHRKADREKPHLTINQSEATLCLNTIRLASYSLEINTGGWDAAEI
ncbi:TPA: hypothetical protein ACG7DV_005306, partial [Escherichia coli]